MIFVESGLFLVLSIKTFTALSMNCASAVTEMNV